MHSVQINRTIYPRLPDIPDEETLWFITTIEPRELAFCRSKARSVRRRYFLLLYLKGMDFLRHSRFQPGELPRLMRLRLSQALGAPRETAEVLDLHPTEKSRVVAEVRAFLSLRPYETTVLAQLNRHLRAGRARTDGNLLLVVNEAIHWFLEKRIELPRFQTITTVSQAAIEAADEDLLQEIGGRVSEVRGKILEDLLEPMDPERSVFDRFKDEVGIACPTSMLAVLSRVEEIAEYLPLSTNPLEGLPRRKLESFSEIGRRFHSAELREFKPLQRKAIVVCYLARRHSQLLDASAEMLMQIWNKTRAEGRDEANAYRETKAALQERHEEVLKALLTFICKSRNSPEMVRRIHGYASREEYGKILLELKNTPSWNECYFRKIEDHYAALRRFLPAWYRAVPLVSTTSDDSILRAIRFLCDAGDKPLEAMFQARGVPTKCLAAKWAKRALVQDKWKKQERTIIKAPYELGVVDATVTGLKDRTIAVEGANRYARMNDHLLPRDAFFAGYDTHLKELGLPATASEYCAGTRMRLAERLQEFDDRYEELNGEFWVNKNGSLGYSRLRAEEKPTQRIKKLAALLRSYIEPVTILDVLLDCHRLTGFMDAFTPLSGRQNMPEAERILGQLATLDAYGCNAGVSQAAEATGCTPQAVLYMRRHFMGVKQLIDAASLLVDCYPRTVVSQHLNDPGIFMTDAMRFSTLKNSLTARVHHRYRDVKSILLYQHITSDCICFFSQASLCNVAEGLLMLRGVIDQKSRLEPAINICDNAGVNHLVLGMAPLLNIEVWPRLRSRQRYRLWAPDSSTGYKRIGNAIAGQIDLQLADECWPDMAWALASILKGHGHPALIAERLNAQPNHPATRGFQELGKLYFSNHALRYGMEPVMRRLITKNGSRREHWNRFQGDVFHAFGGVVRQKELGDQEEIFWFLTVVSNAIVLWNALALERAAWKAKKDGIEINEEDLKHILPTMVGHINFIGHFHVDLDRKPPFTLPAREGRWERQAGPRFRVVEP